MTAETLLEYLKGIFACYDEAFKHIATRLTKLEKQVEELQQEAKQHG